MSLWGGDIARDTLQTPKTPRKEWASRAGAGGSFDTSGSSCAALGACSTHQQIVVMVQSLSRVLLCDPMDCSTPGLPVHRQLPELAQTHVHRVGDAIQPSHPLSSLSPPALALSQHQGLSLDTDTRCTPASAV